MNPLAELLSRHPLPDASHGGQNDKGHVFIVGGPPACPGAVILAATAALRVGAGRVQVAVDPVVAAQVAVAVPELAVYAWNQKASPPPEIVQRLRSADVVVMGPGHQRMEETVVRATAQRSPGATIVLDAGAIGAAFEVARSSVILIAPNPTEAALLLDLDGEDEEPGEAELAQALTERFGQPVAVRGRTTVVADGTECFVFDDPPPGLGTPGSGDVFIGVLAALVAAGLPGVAALGWAVELHARAGRLCGAIAPVGYLAHEVVTALPAARLL